MGLPNSIHLLQFKTISPDHQSNSSLFQGLITIYLTRLANMIKNPPGIFSHGPAVRPSFMDFAQQALRQIQSTIPDAILDKLEASTSNADGVTSPNELEQMRATYTTTGQGRGSITGTIEGVNIAWQPILPDENPHPILGAPKPIIWSPQSGSAITADDADAILKNQAGISTPYTSLSLTSEDNPSVFPENVGWNAWTFTLTDGTAQISFKGKNQVKVSTNESSSIDIEEKFTQTS